MIGQISSCDNRVIIVVVCIITGTLKTGYINYERYLQVAVEAGKATLLASGVSEDRYPLVLRPLTRLPGECGM